MKKMLFGLMLLAAGPAGAFQTTYNLGDFQLKLPLSNVSGVYLYDFFALESLAGAETPIVSYRNLTAIVGVVTDLDGFQGRAGVPFVGAHVDAPAGLFSENFTIGLFIGRDFRNGSNIGGIKASLLLWNK